MYNWFGFGNPSKDHYLEKPSTPMKEKQIEYKWATKHVNVYSKPTWEIMSKEIGEISTNEKNIKKRNTNSSPYFQIEC